MAIKTKEELLNSIKEKFAEDTSDETLQFIEDVSDTFADYETKANDNTDWKKKYEDNDEEWRKKYKDRFFNTGAKEDDIPAPDEPKKVKTFEELFEV